MCSSGRPVGKHCSLWHATSYPASTVPKLLSGIFCRRQLMNMHSNWGGKESSRSFCLLLRNILDLYCDSFSPKAMLKEYNRLSSEHVFWFYIWESTSQNPVPRLRQFQTENRDVFWTSYASSENSSYFEYQIVTANCSQASPRLKDVRIKH